MDLNIIIKFVEGSLPVTKRAKVIQYILENDYMLDVLKGLDNLQSNKSKEQSITKLVKASKRRVGEKIFGSNFTQGSKGLNAFFSFFSFLYIGSDKKTFILIREAVIWTLPASLFFSK